MLKCVKLFDYILCPLCTKIRKKNQAKTLLGHFWTEKVHLWYKNRSPIAKSYQLTLCTLLGTWPFSTSYLATAMALHHKVSTIK